MPKESSAADWLELLDSAGSRHGSVKEATNPEQDGRKWGSPKGVVRSVPSSRRHTNQTPLQEQTSVLDGVVYVESFFLIGQTTPWLAGRQACLPTRTEERESAKVKADRHLRLAWQLPGNGHAPPILEADISADCHAHPGNREIPRNCHDLQVVENNTIHSSSF